MSASKLGCIIAITFVASTTVNAQHPSANFISTLKGDNQICSMKLTAPGHYELVDEHGDHSSVKVDRNSEFNVRGKTGQFLMHGHVVAWPDREWYAIDGVYESPSGIKAVIGQDDEDEYWFLHGERVANDVEIHHDGTFDLKWGKGEITRDGVRWNSGKFKGQTWRAANRRLAESSRLRDRNDYVELEESLDKAANANKHSKKAGPLAEAIEIILHGSESKKLKIFDHDFIIKPAETIRKGNTLYIAGHLSHYYRFRPNDQIYYVIVKEDGKLNTEKTILKIGSGGWTQFAAPTLSAALSAYFAAPVPSEQIGDFALRLGDLVDGQWRTALDTIVASVALMAD